MVTACVARIYRFVLCVYLSVCQKLIISSLHHILNSPGGMDPFRCVRLSVRGFLPPSLPLPGCHGNLAAGTRPVLNFSSSIDPQLNGGALCDYGRTYFDEFLPTCLRGEGFLRHSVYPCYYRCHCNQCGYSLDGGRMVNDIVQ